MVTSNKIGDNVSSGDCAFRFRPLSTRKPLAISFIVHGRTYFLPACDVFALLRSQQAYTWYRRKRLRTQCFRQTRWIQGTLKRQTAWRTFRETINRTERSRDRRIIITATTNGERVPSITSGRTTTIENVCWGSPRLIFAASCPGCRGCVQSCSPTLGQ